MTFYISKKPGSATHWYFHWDCCLVLKEIKDTAASQHLFSNLVIEGFNTANPFNISSQGERCNARTIAVNQCVPIVFKHLSIPLHQTTPDLLCFLRVPRARISCSLLYWKMSFLNDSLRAFDMHFILKAAALEHS